MLIAPLTKGGIFSAGLRAASDSASGHFRQILPRNREPDFAQQRGIQQINTRNPSTFLAFDGPAHPLHGACHGYSGHQRRRSAIMKKTMRKAITLICALAFTAGPLLDAANGTGRLSRARHPTLSRIKDLRRSRGRAPEPARRLRTRRWPSGYRRFAQQFALHPAIPDRHAGTPRGVNTRGANSAYRECRSGDGHGPISRPSLPQGTRLDVTVSALGDSNFAGRRHASGDCR